MKYFVVETVTTHHMKYLIAQPDDHEPEWCLDTVTCEEVDDFDQKFLGEHIINYKECTDEDLRELKKDTYFSEWSVEQMKEVYAKVIEDTEEK